MVDAVGEFLSSRCQHEKREAEAIPTEPACSLRSSDRMPPCLLRGQPGSAGRPSGSWSRIAQCYGCAERDDPNGESAALNKGHHSLPEVLALARSEAVLVHTESGKDFVLEHAGDFDRVELPWASVWSSRFSCKPDPRTAHSGRSAGQSTGLAFDGMLVEEPDSATQRANRHGTIS